MSLPVASGSNGITTANAPSPLIVGVAGGSGSGKSTVAQRVSEELRNRATVECLDMDAYYRNLVHLTLEERKHVNWDHPDSLDFDLLGDHLMALKAGRPVEKPVYDYVSHLRSVRTVRVEPADVVIVDGILLFADERIRSLCGIRVYVDTDADLRLIRRIRRDLAIRGRPLEEILDQYLTTVRPMHLQFVEPGKRYADIIVPGNEHSRVAIDMIVEQVAHQLELREQ